MSTPPLVIMGVSGSGKTTVAVALAARIDGAVSLDADDLHSDANKAKMHAGTPLTDIDRAPWLTAVGRAMAEVTRSGGVPIMACSALKHEYRLRILGEEPEALFVLLDVERSELERRVRARQGHYMPASLLDSQLATLEPLGPGEPGVTIPIGGDAQDVVTAVLAKVLAAR
ncbi:MAG: gluconokinase [Acidobacteria bacterium]|nr:gluconokinase [Acidobacteriota bacterium]